MSRLENFRELYANSGQLVDVKKPAVINFFSGHPPIGQSIGLMIHQVVEDIEGARSMLDAIEQPKVLQQELAKDRMFCNHRGETATDHLFFPVSFSNPLDIRFSSRG